MRALSVTLSPAAASPAITAAMAWLVGQNAADALA